MVQSPFTQQMETLCKSGVRGDDMSVIFEWDGLRVSGSGDGT